MGLVLFCSKLPVVLFTSSFYHFLFLPLLSLLPYQRRYKVLVVVVTCVNFMLGALREIPGLLWCPLIVLLGYSTLYYL